MRNKISNTICGCYYDPDSEDVFYRFVQDKNVKEDFDFDKISGTFIEGINLYNFVSNRVFSREEKGGVIETYLSMLWNDNKNFQDNIEFCLGYLKENRVPLKKKFAIIEIDIKRVIDDVNDDYYEGDSLNHISVTLEDCDYFNCKEKNNYKKSIHFGLWYNLDDYSDDSMLELKMVESIRSCGYFCLNEGSTRKQKLITYSGGNKINLQINKD